MRRCTYSACQEIELERTGKIQVNVLFGHVRNLLSAAKQSRYGHVAIYTDLAFQYRTHFGVMPSGNRVGRPWGHRPVLLAPYAALRSPVMAGRASG